MNKKLTLNDTINIGKNKKVLVSELVNVKGEIFKYIKKGFNFDDDVLKAAKITKIISNERFTNVIVEHEKQKEKIYQKDTETLKNVLKSLHTVDSQNTEDNEKEMLFNTDEQNDDE
jgi:hypothetical protein